MKEIVWGIIGCGDVTEMKSGPAFNKVPDSRLHAVMRRDIVKAADYARRHYVPVFYGNAQELIEDKAVNAIYIATPPDSHEQYSLAAIAAGKPVYVEKPMALNYAAALHIKDAAAASNVKLTVAHYRRAQPYFNAIKKLVDDNATGIIQTVELSFCRPPLLADQLTDPGKAWRVDPAISGGGLFHDLSPHQLGILLYFFGNVRSAQGHSTASGSIYAADDTVKGAIVFESGITFKGEWNFNAIADRDECVLHGEKGQIRFSFFGKQDIVLIRNNKEEIISFPPLAHVQQPLIEKTVQYFLGDAANPCPPEEGCEVMRLIDLFTKK